MSRVDGVGLKPSEPSARELVNRALANGPAWLAAAKRRLRAYWSRDELVTEAYRRACAEVDTFNAALPVFGPDSRKWRAHPPRPDHPAFPEDLRCLPCGAHTRAGAPCRRIDIYGNGRCKLHGGMSTGQRTSAGREKAIANLLRRWKRHAPAQPVRTQRPTRAERIHDLEAKLRVFLGKPESPSEPHEMFKKANSGQTTERPHERKELTRP